MRVMPMLKLMIIMNEKKRIGMVKGFYNLLELLLIIENTFLKMAKNN